MNKILLAVFIIALIPTVVMGSSDIREDVKTVLNDMGILDTLENHEVRISLLEERMDSFAETVCADNENELLMKLALKSGKSVSSGSTTCYPDENICITSE